MAQVTVKLPSLLSQVTGVPSAVPIEAATLREAVDTLVATHPALRVHLFDETGGFRQHVLCFHNDTNTRWLESMEVGLREGDTVTVLQAVSGG